LASQDIAGGAELIVVDDASTDDTWVVLERLAESAALAVRPMRLPVNEGPATARNVGWRAAAAMQIAFTDDDCIPQPGWLAALADGLGDADLVQGQTRPDPAQAGRAGAFSHWIEVTSEQGHYETCNMAYRREVLEAVNGFDETFRLPFGEDLDLAWRAKQGGFRSAFRADALVWHDVGRSSWTAYIRRMSRRRDFVLLCRRYPALRASLGMRVFTHPTAVALVAVLIAALLRPHLILWLTFAALAIRYVTKTVRDTLKPQRPISWIGVVPVRLVADLYDVTVMLRASVRYRTLVI
nr:glycosyltransferase [Actinomycetota bacterium]